MTLISTKHKYGTLLAGFLLLWFGSISSAWALCASVRGQLKINEYNFIDNWIELKIQDPAIIGSLDKIKLAVWKKQGNNMVLSKEISVGSEYTNSASNICGSTSNYIRIPFAPNELDSDVIVVLWKTDEGTNGRVMDLFRLGQSALPDYPASINAGYTKYDFCGAIENALPDPHFDAPLLGNSGHKDIARLPDGTGNWFITNGTGNNSQDSLCQSNNTLFRITKNASSSVVGIGSGSPFTFTFTAINGGDTGSLTNVRVDDTLPANMYLLTCPAGASCSGAAGAYTSISYNFGTLAPNTNASITVTAYVTQAGTYTNMASGYADEYLPANSTSYATVQTITVGSFNVFETSTAANAITGVIRTKVAGTAFGLDVVAISSGAQASSFNDNVKVELLANTGTPGSGYGTDNCPTSNSVLQTIASAAISNGRSTVNFAAVANSYQDVRVRISYPTSSPTTTACSTDSFAIRPNVLNIAVTDGTWQTAGNSNTLSTTAVAGTPIHKAGQPFTVAGTAMNAAAIPVLTTNYAGTPNAVLTACSGTACTAAFGTFALGTGFTGGNLNANTATYSEVGAFNLQLQDTNYALIDSADTPANCSATGYYTCSPVLAVGRFVPDHFDTTVVLAGGVPMACASGLVCPVSYNGMVYSSQPFTLQATARNAAGVTTANYNSATGLAKTTTLTAWNAVDATGAGNQNPGPGTLANNSIASTAYTAGVASTSTVNYTFTSATTPATAIYLRATDTDSVSSLRGTPPSVEGGVGVVSGRSKLSNAYGSELLPLTITVTAQFYKDAASGWVASSTDNNSQFSSRLTSAGGNVQPTIVQGPLALANVSVVTPGMLTLANGVSSFTLAAPGAGRNGRVDLLLTAPAYLPSISGSATFGVYNSNNRLIYQREQY